MGAEAAICLIADIFSADFSSTLSVDDVVVADLFDDNRDFNIKLKAFGSKTPIENIKNGYGKLWNKEYNYYGYFKDDKFEGDGLLEYNNSTILGKLELN